MNVPAAMKLHEAKIYAVGGIFHLLQSSRVLGMNRW